MASSRIGLAAGLAVAAATLGGCVDDGYGYGGVSAGYGPGGYYDQGYAPSYGYDVYGYGGYGYGGYGYGGYGYAGYPGYGWYDGFYYPGTGFYVYDRVGTRRRWDDRQRAYWEARRASGPERNGRGPGAGFARDAGVPGGVRVPPRGDAGYGRDAWRARQEQRGFARGAANSASGQNPQAARPAQPLRAQQGGPPAGQPARAPQGMAPRGGDGGRGGRGHR